MARGKIQIKRIENSTNRQVTYSKRRNGLFKKAHELSILCDAKVSLLMYSGAGKVHEYISPSTTTKQMLDEYQQILGVDLWRSHYEQMQEKLKKLKEVNKNLRREIGQRLGESLNDLNIEELPRLEQDIDDCLKIIRERKFQMLTNQTNSFRKKVKNLEQMNKNLLNGFMIAKEEDPHHGLDDDIGGHYDSVIGFQDVGRGMLALRLQPNQPKVHSGCGSGSNITTYALLE